MKFTVRTFLLCTLLALPSSAKREPLRTPIEPEEPTQVPAETGEILEVQPRVGTSGTCEAPSECVSEKDMDTILTILEDRACLATRLPKLKVDPIQIVVDKEGRVFYSGAEPQPFVLKMSWCNFELEARGKVDVVVAMREPPIWGFRFRPKAYMGLLPTEALHRDRPDFEDLVDAGFLTDFLYYDWANLNLAVGYRSVGLGVGIDLTENFGSYAGYSLTWKGGNHNLNLSLTFSFWNP